MATYNTYQEAKIANPNAYIVTTRDDWDGNESIKGNFEVFDASDQGGHYIGFNSWRICNPSDHCITVEEFLSRGHKLIKGDVYLDYDGEVVEFICVCDNSQSNTNRKENDARYILRAAALEGKPTQTKFVKVEESIFDLREEFERGELYSSDCEGHYTQILGEKSLYLAAHQDSVYRQVEIDWRDEVKGKYSLTDFRNLDDEGCVNLGNWTPEGFIKLCHFVAELTDKPE